MGTIVLVDLSTCQGGSRQALMIRRLAEADLLRTSLECRSVATFTNTALKKGPGASAKTTGLRNLRDQNRPSFLGFPIVFPNFQDSITLYTLISVANVERVTHFS